MDEPRDEAELLARAWDADPEAFQALARRYYRPLGAFLLRKLDRPDLVEDLVQETFLEAFRGLRAGTRPRHFSSWLFGIAKNRAGKWLRRKAPALFDPADPPATPAVEPESVAREEVEEAERRLANLDDALALLPGDTRELLRLKHQDGLTCEELAGRLGRPVGTIKSLLSRAYRQLREPLAPCGEESP
jgi:RNA polymerase sigma-70 factor (ECF subfamily)